MRLYNDICYRCLHIATCKYLDKLMKISGEPYGPDINIHSCANYLESDMYNTETVIPQEQLSIEERMEMLKNISPKSEENEPKIIKNSDESCALCGQEDTDLLVCSVCGKHICPDCATEDFSGKILCEKCYDEAPPDELD